jgi:hypothetical protein
LFRAVVGKTHVDGAVAQDEAIDHPTDFRLEVEEAKWFVVLIGAGFC